jgi:signal transduction histidine kinase
MAELERSHEVLETTVAERTGELTRVVQELRLASQAKTEFLSNVSHELRTPLTSILGFADLLLHGLEGPLTPAQHEDLRTIEISGDRLLALIDELIDVSRIEADEVELEVAPVKLALFLDGIIAEARPRAAQKSTSLDLFLGNAPETVLMDPVRIGAVIVNLLINAVKFTGPGGAIVVEAGLAPDGSLRIDVADNGIGIPPGQREKIFEKFHRVAGPDLPGTGLGLSIAREYARLHGGDVTVESTPGVGSRFSLRIPLEPNPGHRP